VPRRGIDQRGTECPGVGYTATVALIAGWNW